MASRPASRVRSLGFRTDLELLEFQGSTVETSDGCLVVRSPRNPTFHWGNFLLLDGPPRAGSVDHWVERFHTEFPNADHLALGVDQTTGTATDEGDLACAGLVAGSDSVLTATSVREPPRPNRDARYRALDTDSDWEAELKLRLANDGNTSAGHQLFLERRVAAQRRLAETAPGAWLGAFVDGQLCSSLGIFAAGGGLARYQNVGTHPSARGRGLAGTLLYHAGRFALTELDATTLVIVADPDAHAIDIYRSVGFSPTEMQVGLERRS